MSAAAGSRECDSPAPQHALLASQGARGTQRCRAWRPPLAHGHVDALCMGYSAACTPSQYATMGVQRGAQDECVPHFVGLACRAVELRVRMSGDVHGSSGRRIARQQQTDSRVCCTSFASLGSKICERSECGDGGEGCWVLLTMRSRRLDGLGSKAAPAAHAQPVSAPRWTRLSATALFSAATGRVACCSRRARARRIACQCRARRTRVVLGHIPSARHRKVRLYVPEILKPSGPEPGRGEPLEIRDEEVKGESKEGGSEARQDGERLDVGGDERKIRARYDPVRVGPIRKRVPCDEKI
ncbi:hypothetical protein DFH06DRAFT_1149386 [Mycena polygramma]|nr:hypothetical protein DFH06DRAFT_1149386 [Mycena polygramma]